MIDFLQMLPMSWGIAISLVVIFALFLIMSGDVFVALIVVIVVYIPIAWWNYGDSDAPDLFVLVNSLDYKESTLTVGYTNCEETIRNSATGDAFCYINRSTRSIPETINVAWGMNYKPTVFDFIYEVDYKGKKLLEPWIYDIGQREPFNDTVDIIFSKFEDIEDRLTTAYENKVKLSEKYGADFSTEQVKEIDNDIKYLNELGWRLVEPTRRFFGLAKINMMKVDTVNARTQAMQGLKTFTQEIEVAGDRPSEALEQSVADITAAVNNLEKALNQ